MHALTAYIIPVALAAVEPGGEVDDGDGFHGTVLSGRVRRCAHYRW